MQKCLFNRTTGQIYAFAGYDQNIDALASNYTDVDIIETDYRVMRVKPITPIQVNLTTRQVEEVS